MDYTTLGSTGLKVSRVGFGGGGVGQLFGRTTVSESVRTIHRALDLGVNFFDTAPEYGKSEEVLGIALEGRRDTAIIGTKFRLRAEEMNNIQESIIKSVDKSLLRLRTDNIELLHLHNFIGPERDRKSRSLTEGDVLGPVMEGLNTLRQAGKVRFFGIPSWHRHNATLKQILKSGFLQVMLAYYNLLDWTSQETPPPGSSIFDQAQTIPLAKSLNMGVICIRSHAGGALTPQIDRPVEAGNHHPEDIEKAKSLGFLLDGQIQTLSQAAMVFCLMNTDLDTIVPGVKNVKEIEELAGCSDLPPIPEHHLARLRKLYARNFQE